MYTTSYSSSWALFAILSSIRVPLSMGSDLSLPSLPPIMAGQTTGQWIDMLFSDDTSSNFTTPSFPDDASNSTRAVSAMKRSYTEAHNQLHESSWENITEKIGYNLTVDLSSCNTSLRLTDVVGRYTFTNGTTNNDTTLRDIVADLHSIHALPTQHGDVDLRFVNPLLVNAQAALDEANVALNTGLICKDSSRTAANTDFAGIEHNELRRLQASGFSYWTATILTSAIGAAAGAGIAAVCDLIFKGNVTAENVVQTAAVVGSTVLIGGILNRLHEVGRLDAAQQQLRQNMPPALVELAPRGREAVVQGVYMAWVRRTINTIVRRRVDQALSDAGVTTPGETTPLSAGDEPSTGYTPGSGSGSGGVTTPGSRQPSGYSGDVDSPNRCLTPEEGLEAGSALGDMTREELELIVIRVVNERLANRGGDRCNNSP